jgi:DNA invertase Pin-like site-specific DNA recombinase
MHVLYCTEPLVWAITGQIDATTAAGKMVFRMLAVLAEFERDQIAERNKGALGHLRSRGKRINGKMPFGYDLASDGETLVPNPYEQAGLCLIRKLRAMGFGRRRIAATLTARGVPTKTGVPWSPQTIRNIREREKSAA